MKTETDWTTETDRIQITVTETDKKSVTELSMLSGQIFAYLDKRGVASLMHVILITLQHEIALYSQFLDAIV